MADTAVVETQEAGAADAIEPAGTMDDILSDTPEEEGAIDSMFADEVHTSRQKDDGGKDSAEPDVEETPDTDVEKDAGSSDPKDQEDDTEEDVEDKGKPPKGYVPHQALAKERTAKKEERAGRLQAEERLAALEKENAALKANRQEGDKEGVDSREAQFKDFKILSRDDFKALQEDDPIAAQDYLYNLNEYRSYQEEQKAAETAKQQSEQTQKAIIETAQEDMREAAPDLFLEDGTISGEREDELIAFAEENGLDGYSLAVLTDPKTEITIPGDPNRYLLGSAAAGLLKMVVNTQKTLASIDPNALKATAKKEAESEVTREITSKITKSGGDIRSIGDAAPSGGENLDLHKPMTEREWAKLPPEERRRRMGGG